MEELIEWIDNLILLYPHLFNQNNGSGSTGGNLYESQPSHVAMNLEEHTETPELHPHPPPVPLRQGVESTPPITSSIVHGQESNISPPDPTYADPVLLTPTTNLNPPAADPVVYEGLRGFKNAQVSTICLLALGNLTFCDNQYHRVSTMP